MWNSIVFSIFRVVQPSSQSIVEHFHHPKRNFAPISSHFLFPLNAPPHLAPGNHESTCCFYILSILDLSYKWNHTISGILWLASFILHNVFKVHPSCTVYQDFISFYCQIIFYCMDIPYFDYLCFYLFIYFWQCWVFVAARGFSLVAARQGYSLLRRTGFSLRLLLLLQSTGSRHTGFTSCDMRAQ